LGDSRLWMEARLAADEMEEVVGAAATVYPRLLIPAGAAPGWAAPGPAPASAGARGGCCQEGPPECGCGPPVGPPRPASRALNRGPAMEEECTRVREVRNGDDSNSPARGRGRRRTRRRRGKAGGEGAVWCGAECKQPQGPVTHWIGS
jgi:hypothetical protein